MFSILFHSNNQIKSIALCEIYPKLHLMNTYFLWEAISEKHFIHLSIEATCKLRFIFGRYKPRLSMSNKFSINTKYQILLKYDYRFWRWNMSTYRQTWYPHYATKSERMVESIDWITDHTESILTNCHKSCVYWYKNVKVSLCFNWAPRYECLLGKWRYSSTHSLASALDGGVVSFTLRPLYFQGKSPWYPLDRRLGGLQNQSGRGGEEKNFQLPPGIYIDVLKIILICQVKARKFNASLLSCSGKLSSVYTAKTSCDCFCYSGNILCNILHLYTT
jgi:hypothetical protein